MDYKAMIAEAKNKGLTSEDKMWKSVEQLGDSLSAIKLTNPELYWDIMRTQHGIMFDKHYSEEFAKHDVDGIFYTDADGKEHEGAYWTLDEIKEATSGMKFPEGVNVWDKYVVFNACKADFCKEFEDDDIIKIGYLFFFKDEDWDDELDDSPTKIWDYMCCKFHKN